MENIFSLNISTFSHMKHENMGRKMKSVAKIGRKVEKSRNISRKKKIHLKKKKKKKKKSTFPHFSTHICSTFHLMAHVLVFDWGKFSKDFVGFFFFFL